MAPSGHDATARHRHTENEFGEGHSDRSREAADVPGALPAGRESGRKHHMLSLDGGGIRGYWSLLVLQELMERIGEEEERHEDEPCYHSFAPDEFPEESLTREESKEWREAEGDVDEKCRSALSPSRRFRPCHYFDFICGTSTGALIAIMLGRFRMTVKDCLNEYENFGNRIFGDPRFFAQINIGLGYRTKYSTEKVQQAFQEFISKYSEARDGDTSRSVTFPLNRSLCKTFVTTDKTNVNRTVSQIHFMRSYDHRQQASRPTIKSSRTLNRPGNTISARRSRVSPRSTTSGTFSMSSRTNTDMSRASTGLSGYNRQSKRGPGLSDTKNYGEADEWDVSQVAQAATAVPLFFRPVVKKLKMKGQSEEEFFFSDGGLGPTNNPTVEGVREIEELYGDDAIGVVVSIGTARADKPYGRGIISFVKGLANKVTDPETSHATIERDLAQGIKNFNYFRFNEREAVNVDMDEWKPNHRFAKSPGEKTLEKLRAGFKEWIAHRPNQRDMENCARQLVDWRRERMRDPYQWEAYASGAEYRCQERGCQKAAYNHREKLERHLERRHGGVRGQPDFDARVDSCRSRWKYQSPE